MSLTRSVLRERLCIICKIYMHFSPNKNDKVPNNGTMLLTLNGLVIKRVKELKFLGVIIDENLKWDVHTKYINSKLKCEIGKLNRIKKCITKIAHKELYPTLFIYIIRLLELNFISKLYRINRNSPDNYPIL